MDFIRSWVMNIVTLVIFIILIEILIPSGKTKKFVSLVSGFILLIAILNPLLGLFNNGLDLKEIQVSDGNYIDKKDIEASSKVFKENQMKQIAEVYRKKLIGQLEDSARDIKGISGVKADVIINEDYSSDSFGDIKRAYLSITLGKDEGGVRPVAKVEEVRIDGGDKNTKGTKEKPEEVDGAIRKQIESRVNKLFNLSNENIVITLQGKN